MVDKRHRILVVDDLPDWRTTLRGLLLDAGYEVRVAESSEQALELLGSEQFDLAVLDMRLDETDEDNVEGLDLAEQIKHRWPAIQSIIITGYETPPTLTRAMRPDDRGDTLVANFVPKTQTEDLVRVVHQVLAHPQNV